MKNIKIYIIHVLMLSLAIGVSSCNKQLDALAPHNANFEGQQFLLPAGFTKATIGVYNGLAASNYESSWFNLSEFRSSNVTFIDATSTDVNVSRTNIDAFNFTNSDIKDFGYSHGFWFASYQAILRANMVLRNVKPDEQNPVILQAKAECLFLRAFINFNLLRLYGKPYYQSPGTNLGIPLIDQPLDGSAVPPQRATVEASYQHIITDLRGAIANFKTKPSNSFVSKYAAYALLSRVYLYMSGTLAQPNAEYARLATQTADSVIIAGNYRLLEGPAYANYYKSNNEGNTETIWAISHNASTANTLIGYLMLPTGTVQNSYVTGRIKPSTDLLSNISSTDLRSNFYYDDPYAGNTTDVKSSNKYAFGYQVTNPLSSPAPFHHLRLAEVYLNRAEARLKAGNASGALEDLNIIHRRAGLTGYTGLSGQGLMDAILLERRLELAFEGHASYDNFRNGLPMVRTYSSNGSGPLTIAATDPKVVMKISLDVLVENPNIIQNIQ